MRNGKKISPTPISLAVAALLYEQPAAPVVDKARVLAHLKQQMAEHNISVEQKGPEHGDA